MTGYLLAAVAVVLGVLIGLGVLPTIIITVLLILFVIAMALRGLEVLHDRRQR